MKPKRDGSTILTSILSKPKFKVGDIVQYQTGYKLLRSGLAIVIQVKTYTGYQQDGSWADYNIYEVFLQNESIMENFYEPTIRKVSEI